MTVKARRPTKAIDAITSLRLKASRRFRGSSDPSFRGNRNRYNPEELYGGGVVIEGQGPDGLACENATGVLAGTDMDCPPALSDGAGPNLFFNSNLVQGNTAESGSGGGLRLQNFNGADIQNNPNNPRNWYQANITNNFFANNVAGWTGGGVSLQDAVYVNFINNTVASNDTTASAGVLFDTLNAPNANVPPPGCDPTTGAGCNNSPNCNPSTGVGCTNPITTSNFQPSGLSSEMHSLNLLAAFASPLVACPSGHPNCTKFSNPVLDNNLFWQNRAFHICVAGCNVIAGESNAVTLTPVLSQTLTGSYPTTGSSGGSGPNFWDVGVYGDTGAGNHNSGYTLKPLYSILDDSGYSSTNIKPTTSAGFVSQYCNGSRTDFFGNPRPDPANKTHIDIGAVEFVGANVAVARVSPTSLAFGNVTPGTTSAAQTLTLSNTGGATLTAINVVITVPFARVAGGATNCGATLAAGTTSTISVVFSPTAPGASSGTVKITDGNTPVVNLQPAATPLHLS
jgi:hypothetical protein